MGSPILENVKTNVEDMIIYAKQKGQNGEILSYFSYGYREISNAIERIYGKIDDTKNLDALYRMREGRLCPECLVEHGNFVKTRFIHESGEIVCPNITGIRTHVMLSV